MNSESLSHWLCEKGFQNYDIHFYITIHAFSTIASLLAVETRMYVK